MLDFPTRHQTYEFPLDSIKLKSTRTGGRVDTNIVQLTKWRAFWHVDRCWWKDPTTLARGWTRQDDADWRWCGKVRRLRKNPWTRCAGLQVPGKDTRFQGAIIYRRDGQSLLEDDKGALYVEYLAAAPFNRRGYVSNPAYLGVGEALLTLAIAHSYHWNLGGRVSLFSLPGALDFYRKYKFRETDHVESGMIHCELEPGPAIEFLCDKGIL